VTHPDMPALAESMSMARSGLSAGLVGIGRVEAEILAAAGAGPSSIVVLAVTIRPVSRRSLKSTKRRFGVLLRS